MILEKQEKKLMDIVYELASGTSNGQYLVTPQELLERISFNVDFRESDLETNLNRLMLDNYCNFEKAKKVAAERGVEKVYSDYRELLAQPDRDAALRKEKCAYFFEAAANGPDNSERIVTEIKRRLGLD